MFWYNRKPEMCMRCWNYPIIWQKSIETYSQAKKKVVSFPEIRRVKNFLSLTRKKDEYVSESRFLSSKSDKQQQQKNKNQKKQKKLMKKREYLRKVDQKLLKIFRPPEWRFFSSPAFPETRVLSYLASASTTPIITIE